MPKQNLSSDELEAAAKVCRLLDEIEVTLQRVDAMVAPDVAVAPLEGSGLEDGLNGHFVYRDGGFWVYQPAGG